MSTTSSTRKTVFLALGSLATIAGMGLGIGGGALVWAHNSHRDSAGFYSTSAERLGTPSFAMKSESTTWASTPTADASPGVTVDMAVGAKTGALLPIGVGMLAVSIVLLVGGAAMAIAGSTGRRSNPQGNGPASPSAAEDSGERRLIPRSSGTGHLLIRAGGLLARRRAGSTVAG